MAERAWRLLMLLERPHYTKAQHPNAMPAEVMKAVIGVGSTQDTVCDGSAHGYFRGDLDTLPEPLLYREPISKPTGSLLHHPLLL